jgi:hypothetical protein
MSLNIPLNQFSRLRIHGDGPGAVDDSIGDDGLRVDPWERLGGFFGEDGGFGCHFATISFL